MEAIKNHPGARTAIIVWAALCASMLIYAYVGWTMVRDRDPLATEFFATDPRSRMLGLMGLAMVGIGFWMSQRIISYNRHYIPTLPVEKRPGQAVSSFLVPFLIRMAVLESLGLMGLIMTMNSGDLRAVLVLGGVALAGQLALFPSGKRIAAWSGLGG